MVELLKGNGKEKTKECDSPFGNLKEMLNNKNN